MHRILFQRLARVAFQSRRTAHSRGFNAASPSRSHRITGPPAAQPKPLRASMFDIISISTIAVALLVALDKPFKDTWFTNENTTAMAVAMVDGDVAVLRQVSWDSTRRYLAHHFEGTITDEGSLPGDNQIRYGWQVYSQDTCLHISTPTDTTKVPVVCLSVNLLDPSMLGSREPEAPSSEITEMVKKETFAHLVLKTITHITETKQLQKFLLVVRYVGGSVIVYWDNEMLYFVDIDGKNLGTNVSDDVVFNH